MQFFKFVSIKFSVIKRRTHKAEEGGGAYAITPPPPPIYAIDVARHKALRVAVFFCV